MTQVADVMTRGVRTMAPSDPMVLAAQAMEALDVGVLPVCDGERLIGLVTDRDLVLRGMAQGCPADTTPVEEVMSHDVTCCYDDDAVEDVVDQMRDLKIRRVPVIDRDKHLVGMLTLGDVAAKRGGDMAGDALEDISEPAAPDRSGQSVASGIAGGGETSPH